MNRPPYGLELEATVPDGPSTYRFRTADGVCSKDSFRTSELLLLEHVWGADPGDVLCVEANYGVVGTVLSTPADSVRMTESSARAARLCERNSRENDAAATVTLATGFSTVEGRFDTVAYPPKPFTSIEVGNARLRRGLSQLRPDGRLYLAGSKHDGLSRYEACLREAGATVEEVGVDGECRLLEAAVGGADALAGPVDSTDPLSPVESRTLRPTVDGTDLSLATVPGVFAASELDDGTRLLLESARVADGDHVLDLCCGYGAAGVYAARTADCDVWLSDDDRVATRCAERSLRASGVDGTVVTADCVDGVGDLRFDTVLCNPPTHAGSGVLAELLDGAHRVLGADGRLFVVHHRALDLRDHFDRFGRVERVATGTEHVVLRATP